MQGTSSKMAVLRKMQLKLRASTNVLDKDESLKKVRLMLSPSSHLARAQISTRDQLPPQCDNPENGFLMQCKYCFSISFWFLDARNFCWFILLSNCHLKEEFRADKAAVIVLPFAIHMHAHAALFFLFMMSLLPTFGNAIDTIV
jgi:hypothetical protein